MADNNFKDKIVELIKELGGTMHAVRMYGKDHKLTNEVIESLYSTLNEILSEKEEITLGIIGNEIAFDKKPLYEISAKVQDLIDYLKNMESEKITFSRGLDKEELIEFCHILFMPAAPSDKKKASEKTAAIPKMRHITIERIGLAKKAASGGALKLDEKNIDALIKRDYQSSIDFLTEAMDNIRSGQPLDTKSARQLVGGLINDLLKNRNLLLILTSTKNRDKNAFIHDINVAIFTLLQAEALGLEQSYLNDIGTAALLHDAGKISTSEKISDKKSRLTEEEKERLHPVVGAKELLKSSDINILSAITAFEHHMSYNLSGYPKRLYGKKLNFISMMIAISDVYDEMRVRKTPGEENAPEKVYEEMIKLAGAYFHPDLLNNFFSILGVYPPGTLVELDSREIGLVIKESVLDMKRPQVEILYDTSGGKDKNMRMVNLLEKDKKGNYLYSIVKSIVPSDKFKTPEKYS